MTVVLRLPGHNGRDALRTSSVIELATAAWNRQVRAAAANPTGLPAWVNRVRQYSFDARLVFVPVPDGSTGSTVWVRITEL